MPITRRQFCRRCGAGLLSIGALGTLVRAQTPPKIIKIDSRKFEFLPPRVTLQRGQPVILELTSQDVIMGFNAPDFGVRTDIIPGKAQQVRIQPEKVGEFTFICDVFCGDGHENMIGQIIVIA